MVTNEQAENAKPQELTLELFQNWRLELVRLQGRAASGIEAGPNNRLAPCQSSSIPGWINKAVGEKPKCSALRTDRLMALRFQGQEKRALL